MIATQLQDGLLEELEEILKDELFKNESYDLEDEISKEYIPLNFFTQDLPLESSREEDESHFPYIIVKMDSGSVQDADSAHEVKVIVVVGLFDNNSNKQGYRDVMHIINMIYERFAKNPLLCNQYVAKMPFNWALQDEDTHPYYFGGFEMSFEIPAIKKEDEYA